MRKKIIVIITAFALIMTMSIPATTFAKTTNSKTPTGINNGKSNWEVKLGNDYKNAATPPLIVEDKVYAGVGKYVYKLNKTGEVESKSLELDGDMGYATTSLAVSEDNSTIYVAVEKNIPGSLDTYGEIQALKTSDLSIKWTSTSEEKEKKPYKGQIINPITCKGGNVYCGTWNGSNKEGTYFCLDAETGVEKWSQSTKAGYYWAGAYATAEFVAFGSEEGIVYSKKTDGTTISTMKTDNTNIRSTIVNDENNIYFTTKGGHLYKVGMDKETGKLESSKVVSIGETVNTPVIDDVHKKLYVGTNAGKIMCFNMSDMSKIWEIQVPAAIKGEMLLSTGNSGKLCLYATYNKTPGGVYYIELNSDGSKVISSGDLSVPNHKQYCISPITCDSMGQLYYKNDSGYLIAVQSGRRATPAPVMKSAISTAYNKIKITWSTPTGATGYIVYRSTSATGDPVEIKITKSKTYTDTVKTSGKPYYYQVVARYDGLVKLLDSEHSKFKYAKAIPATPSIKTRTYRKKIKVYWSKISGATGYTIYRATRKNGKYKRVKVVKKSSVKSWANIKLKKSKYYYYKVNAYRRIGKKNIYGECSKISYKKTK